MEAIDIMQRIWPQDAPFESMLIFGPSNGKLPPVSTDELVNQVFNRRFEGPRIQQSLLM
jgi:hypothetical protein